MEHTWVIFIEINAMMMLPTSITATSRMFPVFPDTTMSVAHVATKLTGLPFIMARHFLQEQVVSMAVDVLETKLTRAIR